MRRWSALMLEGESISNTLFFDFLSRRWPRIRAGLFFFGSGWRGLDGLADCRLGQILEPRLEIVGEDGDAAAALDGAKSAGTNFLIEARTAKAACRYRFGNGE